MLVLVLIVVLQFEGTRGEELHLYRRVRDNVVLPCNVPASSYRCSNVTWFYNSSKKTKTQQKVLQRVIQSSRHDDKFNMDSNCSLIINNISDDDAGLYTCRPGSDPSSDGHQFLNVLSISNSLSTKDEFTLYCSLRRYNGLGLCPENSFRWLDETGTELTEGVWFELRGPRTCVSSLTVKDQSDSSRFTCQFVEGNTVKVEAPYRKVFSKDINLYHKPGDEAVLPCNRPSSFNSCSAVNWIYERNGNNGQEVHKGIVQSSSRSARLSLDRNCSLIINNINADDAGWYRCQPEDGGNFETHVYLTLVTISLSPPDVDPTKNGKITLYCSLLGLCPYGSLRWLNETGSELTGEGDGYKSVGQIGSVSYLIVNLQSSRRFTCRFVERNKVKIEAQYQHEGPPASSPLSFIMWTLKITGLILMVGITVGIIRTRGRKKPQKDINVRFTVDDDAVSFENDGERSAAAALH